MHSKKAILEGNPLTDGFFLDDSDLFHIIWTRKSSFSFGLFGLGQKWQEHTVFCYSIHISYFIIESLTPTLYFSRASELCLTLVQIEQNLN